MQLVEFIDVDIFEQEINEELVDLNDAMRRLPERAAFYALRAAKARTQASKVDNLVKAIEAKLKTIHRKKLTDAATALADEEGGKPERITADMVNSAVFSDPNMLKYLDIQLQSDEIKNVCMVASDAFRTRREMLKSLGHLSIEQMRATGRPDQGRDEAIAKYKERRAARGGGTMVGQEANSSAG